MQTFLMALMVVALFEVGSAIEALRKSIEARFPKLRWDHLEEK